MKKFISGLVLGLGISAASVGYASDTVQMYLFNARYMFNGEEKIVEDPYKSLNYEGHIYLPIRFIAENTGLQVNYDELLQTVSVKASPVYISKSSAITLAKSTDKLNNDVRWEAQFIDIHRNDSNSQLMDRAVWKVNGLYPASNKTIVTLDAETGEQFSLTKLEAWGEVIPPTPDMGLVYGLAVNALLKSDPGLTREMKYIAVDPTGLKDLGEGDMEEILQSLNGNGVLVMKASFDELKAKGMVRDVNALEGVLLIVEKVVYAKDSILIDGYIFKTGLAAASSRITIQRDGEGWRISSVQGRGVS
ncbi:copper amine oxidase N-terminal domain-containing protein [Paenibacillus sp. WQ 127069]|uniref:Copper amine oxidase N-terminal domain-containing protein n=1 Tax=Paenibacillus baimaensis TaxID=2982185 RepID=A0ABT2UBY8_9BACL|nr:copper amine oxidase N-terminal domain-containing protein [Paenibacillus sp. WQ 127069]MCU6792138.1 copper amine oxidase N-terminal domain-containing protein [Paenibacillus sp. WQ 127069]